jgi:SsrA-binding protein
MKTVAQNRKAYHEYHILESLEAGLALKGTEVKSLRAGRASLKEAYARPEGGELWLLGAHIARYEAGSHTNHEPTRPRKLLLHRDQIDRLASQALEKGLTLVPLKLYFKNGRAKVELGLARGKKLYDKRQVMIQRAMQREIDQATKQQRQQRG